MSVRVPKEAPKMREQTIALHIKFNPGGATPGFSIGGYGASNGEPMLRTGHLTPPKALALAEALDRVIGTQVMFGEERTMDWWVNGLLDQMPDQLDKVIRDAETNVHKLREIRAALTGRY